jgi:hypothetical protein
MAAVLTDFHENMARLEKLAAGLSDDEKIKLQQEIAKEAKKPENIATTAEQLENIGKTAVSTDGAFVTVLRAFEGFVKDYATQFPKTKEFLTKWQGHHKTWKTLLQQSRDFATATSGKYQEYDKVYLDLVQKVENKQDIKDAITALTHFSNETDTSIPMDYADRFKELGEHIKFFRDDFDKYLRDEGKKLTDLVASLQVQLKQAEDNVKQCDKIIRETAKWVEFIPIIGFFAREVTEACMPGTVKKRKEEQAKADDLKKKIADANKAQAGLAKMQTQFAALDSEFQIICGALAIFANTWAYFHAEAYKFALALKDIDEVPKIPKLLISKVQLSRDISIPLQKGLDAYATKIVIPP